MNNKIQELLNSPISEDIALGLFLLNKEQKIENFTELKVEWPEQFIIIVDGYSGWTHWEGSENLTKVITFVEGEDAFSWSKTFDFRTNQ